MYSCNAMQDFTLIRRESLRVHMSLQNYVLVSMILIKYPLSLSLSLSFSLSLSHAPSFSFTL